VLRARGGQPGRPALDVIRDATAEVARPILFAVAIIILVYLPVLALEGVAGKMFRPMALTVILALAGSLVLTMTLMPALAALALAGRGVGERETRLVNGVRALYTPVLRLAERRAGATALLTIALFAGSCLIATRLGGEFLPKLSEGSVVVTSEKLPGINLDASLKAVHRIETVLESFPEVKRVVSLTGSAEIPTDPMGVESTDSFITLADRSTWTTAETQDGLVAAFDKRLREEVPGVAYSFSQPIQMRMDDLLEGVRGDVAISLYGDDLAVLKEKADAIVREEMEAANVGAWQYFAVVPDVRATGVRDGVRAYEWPAIIRAINTVDVMTAEVPELDWALLKRMTDRITHEVPGICRVAYDLTPKPVGTVEWE